MASSLLPHLSCMSRDDCLNFAGLSKAMRPGRGSSPVCFLYLGVCVWLCWTLQTYILILHASEPSDCLSFCMLVTLLVSLCTGVTWFKKYIYITYNIFGLKINNVLLWKLQKELQSILWCTDDLVKVFSRYNIYLLHFKTLSLPSKMY